MNRGKLYIVVNVAVGSGSGSGSGSFSLLTRLLGLARGGAPLFKRRVAH
jgi:hypothetical protein